MRSFGSAQRLDRVGNGIRHSFGCCSDVENLADPARPRAAAGQAGGLCGASAPTATSS